MREPDFSRICGLLQMLIGTLDFHKKHIWTKISVQFQPNTRIQNRENGQKPSKWEILDIWTYF